MTDILPVRRALLSVSDKTGLTEFARALAAQGAEILSTGGSAAAIRDAGVKVVEVQDHTGFPEMMDGRVKTLHPKIHGGLLALRDDPAHLAAMAAHGIAPIDLVAISLYPFEATVARGAGFAETIENIDIGGPAMIRSAAKNHRFVVVLTDAADYGAILAEIAASGGVSAATRRALAAKAFARTAAYDAAIAGWFAGEEGESFPARRILGFEQGAMLRYGENPHQRAALYRDPGQPRAGAVAARQLQGKELSYNNINDADAACELLSELDRERPAIAIIKHANPCGVAYGKDLTDAWSRALACDPVSAFGGIVAMNRPLDAATAEAISEIFTEVILAPDISDAARAVLAKKKNLRLLVGDILADPEAPGLHIRQVAGGLLVQDRDNGRIHADMLRTVTKRAPDARELNDLIFAFRVAKHVKSNAIVYARDGMTVGIGAGQMNRRDSSRIAAIRAAEAAEAAGAKQSFAHGSVVASDAFFPFADGLIAAAEAGATAVIQPGGSLRDEEVIAAADDLGLAMVMTGMRHFRH